VPYGLGANGAWNLIIKATPHAPYWVLPNDDSHFEPGALEKIEAEVDIEAFNFVKVNPKWSSYFQEHRRCGAPRQLFYATQWV